MSLPRPLSEQIFESVSSKQPNNQSIDNACDVITSSSNPPSCDPLSRFCGSVTFLALATASDHGTESEGWQSGVVKPARTLWNLTKEEDERYGQ